MINRDIRIRWDANIIFDPNIYPNLGFSAITLINKHLQFFNQTHFQHPARRTGAASRKPLAKPKITWIWRPFSKMEISLIEMIKKVNAKAATQDE